MLTIIFSVVLVIFIYLKIFKPMKYWEKYGIPYIKPQPIFGNMSPTFFRKRSLAHSVEAFYKAFPDKRYFGFHLYMQPSLCITDLELIKQITIKDFDSFTDHRTFAPCDPLWSKNLVSLSVKDGWHEMRTTISPSFTSSKLKSMFGIMKENTAQLINHLQERKGTFDVELRDVVTRCTTDIILNGVFGISCDSLKHPNNEFYLMAKDASDFGGIKGLKLFGHTFSPFLAEFFKINVFGTEVSAFFRNLIKETIKIREEKQIARLDMIHLLVEARKHPIKNEDELNGDKTNLKNSKPKQSQITITDDDITAHALSFFLGGFASSSATMCHAIYELALDSDMQNKLREEIDSAVKTSNEKITYEALMGMTYLDCIVSETLRMWPSPPFIDRISTKPYTIKPTQPGEKPLHVEPGIPIWIPNYAIQRDPKYFPNPDKFDPERFNDQNKHNIKPFTYLPFGTGPRNCIGSRFALLEIKLVVAEIVRTFEIQPCSKTQIPIILSKKNFVSASDEGYWFQLKPRILIE